MPFVSKNGYDSSGRTVYYRGKNITYFDEDANAIKRIGNISFTYTADGLRFKIGVGAEVLVGKKSALSATLGMGGGLNFAIVDKGA